MTDGGMDHDTVDGAFAAVGFYLFMGLMLTMGVLGAQAVSASNINQPPIMEPGIGEQQPGICLPCFWGIKNMQQKTLFHASNTRQVDGGDDIRLLRR